MARRAGTAARAGVWTLQGWSGWFSQTQPLAIAGEAFNRRCHLTSTHARRRKIRPHFRAAPAALAAGELRLYVG